MIQDFFLPLYFTSNHIYIFVSLHTFWTYCTAIYGLTLFLNIIVHNTVEFVYNEQAYNEIRLIAK